jgi:pimeloyl-ACP methyl ester carboxylesterase
MHSLSRARIALFALIVGACSTATSRSPSSPSSPPSVSNTNAPLAPAASSPPAAPAAQAEADATREAKAQADARYDAVLSAASYPFPVRYLELRTQRQQLRMAYMDVQPERPNGRSVLLLHGKNFAGFYWEPTVRRLLEQGFRVVVPDQIGFGKSSKPQAYQFSFQALAENTRALLAELRLEHVAVVGHSMGGMLAVRFALLYPTLTEKLVLVSPIGLEDWKRWVPARSVDEWYTEELKATPSSLREYQKQAYYAGNWRPEYEALLEYAAGMTQHPDYPKVAWCSALSYDMIFNQPVLYELQDLKPPTLLIIGLRDRTAIGRGWAAKEIAAKLGNYRELGKRAAANIPHAKLVELEGVGHLPQVEAFDAYAQALLAFLK